MTTAWITNKKQDGFDVTISFVRVGLCVYVTCKWKIVNEYFELKFVISFFFKHFHPLGDIGPQSSQYHWLLKMLFSFGILLDIYSTTDRFRLNLRNQIKRTMGGGQVKCQLLASLNKLLQLWSEWPVWKARKPSGICQSDVQKSSTHAESFQRKKVG